MVGRSGRQEVVAVLFHGLRSRPVVPRPAGGTAEGYDRLLARIDTPGHAAVLGEDQYRALYRGAPVVWRGVLSFIARAGTPAAFRAFWLDPTRFVMLGCRLAEGEARLIMPALDGVAYSAAAVTQCEPGLSSDHYREGGAQAMARSSRAGGASLGPATRQEQVSISPPRGSERTARAPECHRSVSLSPDGRLPRSR
jgi:hypothetical protein